jgi:hypothetical protein
VPYLIGNASRVQTRFRNAITGAPVDPTTLTLKIKDPALVETTYVYGVGPQIIKESVGVYYYDLPLIATGTWRYRWEGTGTNMAASEGSLVVNASAF